MTSILLSLPELYNSYKAWVSKNPQTASDYETSAKWISYFIAGRINNSHTISELVYCISNLLILFNDRIIKHNLHLNSPKAIEKIKLWLAIVEYSEVFCELSVQKFWGKTGKWIVIVAIQVFKCVARFLLIYKHKEIIAENPTIPPLDRVKFAKQSNAGNQDICRSELGSVSFTLKRSGRVVRKVESSPPLVLRTWKPVEIQKKSLYENGEVQIENLTRQQLVAETIYLAKPIVHLLSLGVFGSKTWKPWMVSLTLDLASLQLYNSSRTSLTSLSNKQQLQLSKRMVLLLLYLIRSPFYEKHSKNKINAFLMALSNNVPLIKIICLPLMQYLPFWQSNYFYMWSS
ncbi:peroxisomal membrane protein PEX16 [Euwallacea fornicatus]|uniref:peroxisomal membrane protein PEX16 n=1 Tax=Euwallacea fornicatus TaxID=995702 RepID=UPI0033906B21